MKFQYSIKTEKIEAVPFIFFEGDMTSDSDAEMKKVYSALKEENGLKALVIDFEKTQYINSSGIATLIHIIQDMNENQCKLVFVGLSDHFKNVMEIVGLIDFALIVDTTDDALKIIQ
jgi:anti-anti-sigma factor